MTVNANCRIRRIYFADKLYEEDEIPADYRMYVDRKAGAPGAANAGMGGSIAGDSKGGV